MRHRDRQEGQPNRIIAACMHLLAGGFSTGLIASSHTYDALRIPWGSNPLTDPLLSSVAFSIVHDGCELTRSEKAEVVAGWDEARRNLRVCWAGESLDRNCGTCMHCIGTALYFASLGRPIPTSMPVPTPADADERLRALETTDVHLGHYERIVGVARARDLIDPWVTELELFVADRRQVNERRPAGWNPFRH